MSKSTTPDEPMNEVDRLKKRDELAKRLFDKYRQQIAGLRKDLAAMRSERDQWQMSAEATDTARASLGERVYGLSAALREFTTSPRRSFHLERQAQKALDKYGLPRVVSLSGGATAIQLNDQQMTTPNYPMRACAVCTGRDDEAKG